MTTTAPTPSPPRGVTGPIPRELLRLALPVLASHMLRIAYQWVDALWVRGLGVEATAAVTTSMFVMWTTFSLQDVFGVGVSAYVSQLMGAGDRRRAGVAAYKGLRAAALLGVALGLAGVAGARWIYEQLHVPPGVVENGAAYLSIILGGSVFPLVALASETVLRASGNTRVPLVIDVCAVTLNALLDPLLIYGVGPFPRLGVAGAAWATVIAQATMVACYAVVALRRHPAFPLARTAPGPPVRLRGLLRVGAPAALIGILFSVVYLSFSRSAARFGAASLAIVGIVNRIEAIQFVTGASIGIAASALVGQNLGAGRPDRAVKTLRTGLLWSCTLSTGLTALLIAFPATFLSLFSRDPEVLRLGVPYLRLLSTCLIATGAEIVIAESLMGSGHTRVLSTIYNAFSIARIPLGFWVPTWMGNGVLGIAWLITITCNVRTALIALWASRGTWKRGLAHELTQAPEGPTVPDVGP